MKQDLLQFYPRLPGTSWESSPPGQQPRLEPATCTEAETFALQVLDDSMQPEFRRGCIIIIDPTGHARDGSYVLARSGEGHVFRQLVELGDGQWQIQALNPAHTDTAPVKLPQDIAGVIVQRAGVRRRYHKRYE